MRRVFYGNETSYSYEKRARPPFLRNSFSTTRVATCQLWPQPLAANVLPDAAMPCVKQAQSCATALAVSWEEALHSSLTRVRAHPR